MKIQKCGERGRVKADHCVYVVYDENAPFDEAAEDQKRIADLPAPQGVDPFKFRASVAETAGRMARNLYKAAYGFRRVCYFTVFKGKRNATKFEFDSDRKYTDLELRIIIGLSKTAFRRTVWED
jgi:hypothetical protein